MEDGQDFLLLIHGREARDLSPHELGQHLSRWNAWIDALRANNQLQSAGPLTAQSRVVRKGEVIDGPFAETKDAISGYLIVRAADLGAAAELAKSCPAFEVDGWVEVREIGNG